MGKRTMAVRYARAIADILPGQHDLSRVRDELRQIEALASREPELFAALAAPGLPGRRRKAAAEKVFGALDLHPASRRTLVLLVENGQLSLAAEVAAALSGLCDERERIVAVEVTTAVEIPGGRDDVYRQSLERLTGKRVRLRTRVDPAILGGVVTRIGSEVYDGSLQGGFLRLKQRLKGE
ncbi:MAG: ATP synthase F1 subunit delta [Acidobacteriota bacterium]